MTACPHTILKTLKRESNDQLCLALKAANNKLFSYLALKTITDELIFCILLV